MWAGYVQKAYLKQSRGLDENLTVLLTNYRPVGRNAVSFVPLVLEKISEKEGEVFSAGRRSTRILLRKYHPIFRCILRQLTCLSIVFKVSF